MGPSGASSILGALRKGACSDLRDLGLAGNIIGTDSIKACEEVTRIRPLLRIIATRGDRIVSVSMVLAFVLFWPFITTVAAICGRAIRDAAQEQSIMSSLQVRPWPVPSVFWPMVDPQPPLLPLPQAMPTSWAQEVYQGMDDIQRVNRQAPNLLNLQLSTTAIEVEPSYLSSIREEPLKPSQLEDYLDGGGILRLATVCHQLRTYLLLAADDYDHPIGHVQKSLAGLVVHLLGWRPDFFSACLSDEVPLSDHGAQIIAGAMRSGQLPRLHTLVLRAQSITSQGAIHLASAIQDGQVGGIFRWLCHVLIQTTRRLT